MKLLTSLQGVWAKDLGRYIFVDGTYEEFDGTVAHAFGGGGGGGSEVVPTGPWGPQIPSIMNLLQRAENLYQQGAPQYPDFSTVADPNATLTQSQNDITNFVQGQQGTNQGAIDAAGNLASTPSATSQIAAPLGGDLQRGILQLINSGQNSLQQAGQQVTPGAVGALNTATRQATGPIPTANFSGGPQLQAAQLNANPQLQANLSGSGLNPYIEDVVGAATRSLTNNFQRNVLPSIGDQASAAGQYGGSRQGVAEGIAAGDYQQSVGDVTAQLFGQGFDRNVDVRENAIANILGQQGQQGGLQLGTGQLNEQIRSGVTGQGLDAAKTGLNALQGGVGLGIQGTGAGTAQAGNLFQTGANQDLARITSGLGLIPSLQGSQLAQYGAQNQAGLQQQGFQQAGLDDAVNRYFFNMFSPYNALAQYQNFIGGQFGSSVGGNSQNLNFPGVYGTTTAPPIMGQQPNFDPYSLPGMMPGLGIYG